MGVGGARREAICRAQGIVKATKRSAWGSMEGRGGREARKEARSKPEGEGHVKEKGEEKKVRRVWGGSERGMPENVREDWI